MAHLVLGYHDVRRGFPGELEDPRRTRQQTMEDARTGGMPRAYLRNLQEALVREENGLTALVSLVPMLEISECSTLRVPHILTPSRLD